MPGDLPSELMSHAPNTPPPAAARRVTPPVQGMEIVGVQITRSRA